MILFLDYNNQWQQGGGGGGGNAWNSNSSSGTDANYNGASSGDANQQWFNYYQVNLIPLKVNIILILFIMDIKRKHNS